MSDSPHDNAALLKTAVWACLCLGMALPMSPAAVRWVTRRRLFARLGPSPLSLWLMTRLALTLPCTYLFFFDPGSLKYSPTLLFAPVALLTGVADYLRLWRLAADHGLVPADPMAPMDFSGRPPAAAPLPAAPTP